MTDEEGKKVAWSKRKHRRVGAVNDVSEAQTDEDIYRLQQERAYEHFNRRSSSHSSLASERMSQVSGRGPSREISRVKFSDAPLPPLTTPTPPPPPSKPKTFEYYAGDGEGRWDHQDFALICFATVNNFANIARKVNELISMSEGLHHSNDYFSALCRENGGIIFMLIYAFLEITLALPITYMEMIIGQFTKSGVVEVWRLCPLFKGIGITLVCLIFGFTMFFPVLVSWFLQYAILSVTDTYVWSECHNETNTWNTPQCREDEDTDIEGRTIVRATEEYYRIKIVGEKWERDLSRDTPLYGPTNLGKPSGPAMTYIILIYVIVLFVISFGPRVLGRAVHVSTAFPAVFLMILTFRGLSLAGALSGLREYFSPDFSKFASASTWRAAISQVVTSTQCGQGYYTTYSSYNQFKRPIFRYAVLTICLDLVFSLIGGILVFSFLGYSGYRRHKPVFEDSKNAHVSGETIMYELMPEAFSRTPMNGGGDVLAFIFFIMIFLNTVDNMALMIDILTTAVMETFRSFFAQFQKARSVIIFLIILCSLILNIVFTTPGGVYLMTIFSKAFGGGTNYLICCFLTLFAITCLFGDTGIRFAIRRMTGNVRGFKIFRIVWVAYSLPFVGVLVFLSAVGDFTGNELAYRNVEINGGKWAAICMTYASVLAIPIFACVALSKSKSKGCTGKMHDAASPEHESLVPQKGEFRRHCIQCPCVTKLQSVESLHKIFRRNYEMATARRYN